MDNAPSVLTELLELGQQYSGRQARSDSRIYADLNINGTDFIELVETVERLYQVDLSWVSPREAGAEARDPTIQALADYVINELTTEGRLQGGPLSI